MLKSCLSPGDLRIGSRHLLEKKAFTYRHALLITINKEQCRHKVHKSPWRESRRSSQPGNTQLHPEPKLHSPETRQAPVLQAAASKAQKSRAAKARPTPRSSSTPLQYTRSQSARQEPSPVYAKLREENAETETDYRRILIKSVRPTPDQDLSSTRPAKLESPVGPVPEVDGSVSITVRTKYLYALGRSYLSFFKTGLKNIWNNRKEYNEIKARLGPFTAEDAALYGGQTKNGRFIPTITRREYQLYLRTRHDLLKLLPFGLVFAICGEFTPLVILALGSSVVPITCRIPKMVQADRKKLHQKRHGRDKDGTGMNDLFSRLEGGIQPERSDAAMAFLYGVSPLSNPLPVLHKLWILPRLRRRGLEILADTALIRREGGFGVLETIEICQYAEKIVCAIFIRSNAQDLEKTQQILWDGNLAQRVKPYLEDHATILLSHHWEHIPDQERWRKAVILDDYNQPALIHRADTGKLPDRDS